MSQSPIEEAIRQLACDAAGGHEAPPVETVLARVEAERALRARNARVVQGVGAAAVIVTVLACAAAVVAQQRLETLRAASAWAGVGP